MSFTRVKPLGWGYLEVLTSNQMNAIDTHITYAVDSRGGSYTNVALLAFLGATRLANADITFSAASRANGATIFPVFTRFGNGDITVDGKAPFYVALADQATTNHDVILARAGAVAGNTIVVSRGSNAGGYSLSVYDNAHVVGSATPLINLGPKQWAVFAYDDGSGTGTLGWYLVMDGTNA